MRILETERLLLRTFQENDVESLIAISQVIFQITSQVKRNSPFLYMLFGEIMRMCKF